MDIKQYLTVFIFSVEAVEFILCQPTNGDAQFGREDYCICQAQSPSVSEVSESLQISLAKLSILEALQKYDTEEVQHVKSEMQNLTRAIHLVKQDNLQQKENLERLVNLSERRFYDVDASLASIVGMLQRINSTLFHLTQRVQLIEDKSEKHEPCRISDEQFCLRKNMSNFNGSCYSFVQDVVVNWTDARKYCKDTFGADLVGIETQTENNYLKEKVEADPGTAAFGFWTSLKRTNNTWRWESTGKALQGFTDWSPGEPNFAGENCGNIRTTAPSLLQYTWNNLECTCKLLLHLICELKL